MTVKQKSSGDSPPMWMLMDLWFALGHSRESFMKARMHPMLWDKMLKEVRAAKVPRQQWDGGM